MANRRRKELTEVEAAKRAGAKALEDAKAGRIQREESENEVRGYAEIPRLEDYTGGNSPVNRPSVAVDNSTIPVLGPERTVEPIGGNRDYSYEMERLAREANDRQQANLTDKDKEKLAKIDADMADLTANGGLFDDTRLALKQRQRDKIMGQTLSQSKDDQSDVMSKWLDNPNYKMTKTEEEQARQIIRDYEQNEYKNPNVNDLTKEEQRKLSQINALRNKISNSETYIENAMNFTEPIQKYADDDFYGWSYDQLQEEAAQKSNIPMTSEQKAAVNQIKDEIDYLNRMLNDPDFTTGDKGADAITGLTRTLSPNKIRRKIKEREEELYKTILRIDRGTYGEPDYESYEFNKQNMQTQNPLAALAGDLTWRAAATAAGQKALGNTNYGKAVEDFFGDSLGGKIAAQTFEDLPIDIATDTIPELASNLAGGMPLGEALEQAFENAGINTAFNFGMANVTNAGDLIPALRNTLMGTKGSADDVVEDVARQIDIPKVSNGAENIAEIAKTNTDDISIAKRQADAGVGNVQPFKEILENDALKELDKRGKISEIINNYPEIKRQYNGPVKPDEVIESEINSLRSQMDNYAHGGMEGSDLFDCGTASGVLRDNGIQGNKIMMSQKVYDKITLPYGYKGGKHGLGQEGVEKIVRGLNDPVLIMTSDDGEGVAVVINYTNKNGSPVFVPMTIGKNGVITDVDDIVGASKIKSAHPRNGLDNYLEKRASQIRYIKGEDETLSKGLDYAELESSSPIDSSINLENGSVKGAKDFTSRDLENSIRQSINDLEMSPEIRAEVEDRIKDIDTILDRIDNAKSMDELMAIADEGDAMIRDTDKLLKDSAQSRLIGKYQFDEDTKNFIEAINGTTIKVPDNMRAEFPDQTLKQLQAKLHFYGEGKNYGVNLRKNSGTPIESLFEDIDNATGHALSNFMESQGYNAGSPEGQMRALIEYADSLKANQNSSKLMDYNGGIFSDYADEYTKRLGNKAYELRNAGKQADSVIPENAPAQNLDAVAQTEKGNGPRQTSKYRTNSMEKLDSVNDTTAPMDDYGYNTYSVEQQKADALARWGNNPNAVRELQAKDNWDEVDARYAQRKWIELMESGNEEDIKEAQRLSRKMSYELREGGRLVQTAAEMDDIAGQLNQARQMLNQRVDSVYGIGTSEALDNMVSKIEIALDDIDLKTKEGRDEAVKVMAEMMNKNLRTYAPTNKNMASKSFKGADKILRDLKNGKIDSVDKLVERVYKQNGGIVISGADQKKIYDLLESATTFEDGSREQEKALARAAKIATKGTSATLGEGVRSILYMNMLGNFKTAISRNAFGNLGYQVLEQARSPIAGLVDRGVSLFTKQHSSQGWNLGKAKAYVQGFKKGASDQLSDILSGVDTGRSGNMGWADALKNNKSTWNETGNSAIGRGLAKVANKAEFYVTNAMELGDRPFFEANYAQRRTELRQLVEKYGKENVAGLSGIPDELLDDTIDMMSAVHAADSVFQKQGKISSGLTKLREGLSDVSKGAVGVDLLSTSATPFTMTPGNILERGIEYSPLGLIKNAVETAVEAKGGNFNQKRFVDELSRTITGIPVLGGAYALAKNGGISGGYSDDPDERASQQADGFIEYGLNVPENVPIYGGRTLDTSDIPVFGQFMQAAGAINEDGLNADSLKQALDAITMGSVMQGMRKAFGGDLQYSTTGSMIDNLANTVKSAGTQLIPSLVRQTAQTTDEYKRDLGEYGTNQYYLNNIINSIPGLRETLPVKYDSEGNEVLQNQGRSVGEKILENYLLPMAVSEYSPSELTQEASRLAEATDNNAGFVPRASRSDYRKWAKENEGVDYSEEKFYEYKKDLGSLNRDTGEAILKSDFYQGLSDDEKVDVLADVYAAMKQVAKYNATGLGTDNKMAKAYMDNEDDPMAGLMEELEAKYNPYGLTSDAYKAIKADEEGDFTPYEGYGDALTSLEMEDNADNRTAYASGKTPEEKYANLENEKLYQEALEEYGLTDNQTNRGAWDSALHASADPMAALQKAAANKEAALNTGFVSSDGSVNQAAYDKAVSVLGDDPAVLSNYASFKDNAKSKEATRIDQYIPMVEAIPGLTYEQKGQYAYLYGGEPTGKSAQKALANSYETYYLYRLLQNAPDLNENGKAHDTGDRIKYLYNLGYGQDKNPDMYNFLTDPDMSY